MSGQSYGGGEHAGEVETDRPNSARMYDYYLGGAANFAVDRDTETETRDFLEAYQRTATPAVFRTREQIAAFTAGYELLHPGLVLLQHWRPEIPVSSDEAEHINCYGAVACCPTSHPTQRR